MEIMTLGTVATYINGRAFKPSEWEEKGLPIIRIQNLNDETAKYHYTSVRHEEKYLVKKDNLLFAWSASLGAHIWKGPDAWLNQHIFRVIPGEKIDKQYLYYYLCQVVSELYSKTHGSGIVHITKAPFMATKIPVPPIPEQERIVAKIEELFSDLDASVAELNTAKEKLKVYRQAVLKEVFSKTCPKKRLDEVSTVISGYAFKSKAYDSNGKYTVVKIGNVKNGKLDFSKDRTKTNEADNHILKKYLLQSGDCLITMTGTRGKRDYGYTSVVGLQTNLLLNQRVAALRLNCKIILPEYCGYYLGSPIFRDQFFAYETGNVGQGNVGVKALKETYIATPSLDEQHKIVNKIDEELTICNNIEQTIDTALQQSEALRQSILKKAFEGELI